MSADPKGATGQATQQGTPMAGSTTSAWPRSVTGPQAIERVRSFLSDQLYPLLTKDEHFRSGSAGRGFEVIEQMPQVLDYLRIAGEWCQGQTQGDPATTGGQSYPNSGKRP